MTDPTPPATDAAGTDRRGVLRGAAAIGVAGALAGTLAACGGDDGATGPGGQPSGAGDGQPSGAIVSTSEVPLGGGAIVNAGGTKVVVTQPADGSYKAFTAVCTHQGCTVNSVERDVIFCPCHASEFSASTGEVVSGPATAPLASIPVTVADGTVSFA